MTHVVRVRPAVGMQQLVGVPYVVALGVCGKMEGAGIAWPHTIVDATSKEVLSEVVSHAGYDEGMFVDVTLDVDESLDEAIRTYVDAWAAALAGRPVLGPLAPVLEEYANKVTLLGEDVLVTYPNGKVYAQGTFVGLDVWGRATVRLVNGQELEFAAERFGIRPAV